MELPLILAYSINLKFEKCLNLLLENLIVNLRNTLTSINFDQSFGKTSCLKFKLQNSVDDCDSCYSGDN